MPAQVSLAFAMTGTPARTEQLLEVLTDLSVRGEGSAQWSEGGAVVNRVVRVRGHELGLVVQLYDEEGWLSVVLDIDEAAYETVADRIGRAAARDELIALAIGMGNALGLDYIHLDEGAEAECEPGTMTVNDLHGITILPASASVLPAAMARTDLREVVELDGWRVLMFRLDPVPHHPLA